MKEVSLNYLRKGDRGRIQGISTSEEGRKHLNRLGLVVGATVEVVATYQEEMIVGVKGSRLGLSKEYTQAIQVERVAFEASALVPLSQVVIGETVRIANVKGEPLLRKRLMDMGITKNAKIRVLKIAPLGDPLEVRVRGYQLSLRKQEADFIETVAIGGTNDA
ncbi:ferrous iron transport protein A [Facklamia sp. DSM 111018]|uniref:Ferrous iron transport protein A n=1 Tax=Facklamia lactis TaxID=2749967 RepID=A0ABS0LS40_9LACT|nr:ferrous iron transport protein A [Facklamia lactis]MBG9986862.1 ferrous iron transport protein A [Facklamia lactis]